MEKHSFPLQEEATEQTPHVDSAFRFLALNAILAAVLSSVKQGKQTISSENVVIEHLHPTPPHRPTPPLPSLPVCMAPQVNPARKLQEQSAACCPSPPRVLDEHRPPRNN